MTITLYRSPGERNRLSRSMTVVKTMNAVEATESINVSNPEVLINRDDSIIGFDYAYIPAFNRYYFLNDMEVVNGQQFKLYLESDPLMSFRDAIFNSSCVAKRSTSSPNMNIVDDLVAFKPIPERKYTKMSTGFTPSAIGGSYILTIGGR